MGWGWFQYIFYISLLLIIFNFLWKWIIALPAALLQGAIGFESNWLSNLIYVVGNYLLVSFIALYGLGIVIENDYPLYYSIFIYVLGGLIYICQALMHIGELQKDFEQSGDYSGLNTIPYKYMAILFALVMYVIILFIPQVGLTSIGFWFLDTIAFISNIKFVGWALSFFAFLYTLYIVFTGLIIILGLIGSIFTSRQDRHYTDFN